MDSKKMWQGLLESNDTPVKFKVVIEKFMLPYEVDFYTYTANHSYYLSSQKQATDRVSKSLITLVNEYSDNSYQEIPEWFIVVFPDIVHYCYHSFNGQIMFESGFKSINQQYIIDGSFSLEGLRKLVQFYLTTVNKTLECTVTDEQVSRSMVQNEQITLVDEWEKAFRNKISNKYEFQFKYFQPVLRLKDSSSFSNLIKQLDDWELCDWESTSRESPLTEGMIISSSTRLNFYALSDNKMIKWSDYMLYKFKDKINWESENLYKCIEYTTFTFETIEYFESYINWKWFGRYIKNTKSDIHDIFIKYSNKWNYMGTRLEEWWDYDGKDCAPFIESDSIFENDAIFYKSTEWRKNPLSGKFEKEKRTFLYDVLNYYTENRNDIDLYYATKSPYVLAELMYTHVQHIIKGDLKHLTQKVQNKIQELEN